MNYKRWITASTTGQSWHIWTQTASFQQTQELNIELNIKKSFDHLSLYRFDQYGLEGEPKVLVWGCAICLANQGIMGHCAENGFENIF